ncbi:hypothetical protein D047_0318B, partial [Vibrio parahaemolyticus VPTS-2010_2]
RIKLNAGITGSCLNAFVIPSDTAAVVVPEYCGYNGSTITSSTP